MANPRNKKMAVWMTQDDYNFWADRAWAAHQATSLFVNDQLIQIRRVLEKQDGVEQAHRLAVLNNQRKPNSSRKISGNDGKNGGMTDNGSLY